MVGAQPLKISEPVDGRLLERDERAVAFLRELSALMLPESESACDEIGDVDMRIIDGVGTAWTCEGQAGSAWLRLRVTTGQSEAHLHVQPLHCRPKGAAYWWARLTGAPWAKAISPEGGAEALDAAAWARRFREATERAARELQRTK